MGSFPRIKMIVKVMCLCVLMPASDMPGAGARIRPGQTAGWEWGPGKQVMPYPAEPV